MLLDSTDICLEHWLKSLCLLDSTDSVKENRSSEHKKAPTNGYLFRTLELILFQIFEDKKGSLQFMKSLPRL